MALRKKSPSKLTYKDYMNSNDSYRMSYDAWVKKNEWEDTDYCSNCNTYIGSAYRCPKCD